MSDNEQQDKREPFDWGSLFRRKDRPLPPRGCSVAFYIFLALLMAALVTLFVLYRSKA